MTRSFLLPLAATFAACPIFAQTAPAQTTNPLIAETRAAYNSVKGYLTRAAAAMPESDYNFKPTPDVRTFGALLAHIADHQVRYCSAARGAARTTDFATKTTKADLVDPLAASFKECDAAWDSLTDANATEMMGQRSKLGALILDVVHSNEEYGYMSMYFRIKGIVPPSSDRAGRK